MELIFMSASVLILAVAVAGHAYLIYNILKNAFNDDEQ